MEAEKTIHKILAEAALLLRDRGIESARLDAEVLLAFVLKAKRQDLYINSNASLTPEQVKQYMNLVQRRAGGEPIAYITGHKEFMSLDFNVSSNVLIPRPETELIVEEALEIKPLYVIDVGTGSGAIGISIAHYLPGCHVTAVDISPLALETARTNAAQLGVSDRVHFYLGNLLEPVPACPVSRGYDLITANLPYIPSCEMDKLPVDVKEFEPILALDGGGDGLKYYYILCAQALNILASGGVILMEIGYDQGPKLAGYLKATGLYETSVIKDLAGLDRIVKAVRK